MTAPQRARPMRPAELAMVRAEEAALAADAPIHLRTDLALRRWRIIHRHFHEHPFTVPTTLPRAEQWDRVRRHVIETVDEPELVTWLSLQVEVADNLARGIRDLRPRKNGPCYDIFMEVVRDRKRKALAIHRWTLDAERLDPVGGCHHPGRGTRPAAPGDLALETEEPG